VSVPPAPPLVLASRSPQRRAILEQLGIPFDVVLPEYEEQLGGSDPAQTVRENARGKARSVAGAGIGRPVLGVDTEVVLDGRVFGKARTAAEAEAMLEALAGQTHEVVSGLCLFTPAWEEVEHEVTRVSFRELDARDLAAYVGIGEWEGRAGAYAVQGRGAGLVERIEGDYLNVVGLPAALLVRLLATRFPGVYGFG
jgi:nucleoside triphosphate pyrophosphatase